VVRVRVLVVDDDEAIREVIQDVLGAEGVDVVCAADGAEALRLLATLPLPAAILVDERMPVMGGHELIRAVAADSRLAGIPITLMTGSGEPHPPGVAALPKPFSLDHLLAFAAGLRPGPARPERGG
jgi:CheY-like chemotaxis protein